MKQGRRRRSIALRHQKAAPLGLSTVFAGAGGLVGASTLSQFFEWLPGSFQREIEMPSHDRIMAQATVFACMTLIAGDIGKLCLELKIEDGEILVDFDSPAFSPVLRKPNHFQTTQKFVEGWVVSKLSAGNTYVLKVRDRRQVVTAMYVLDPRRVQPMVSPSGSVFYGLGEDDLNQVPGDFKGEAAVPASEIMHDRMICLFHPLVGVTPIFACGLAAAQALAIQQNSAQFFQNSSRPSGILTAPRKISDELAARLKREWDQNYRGRNTGKVAVLGDSMEYKPMGVNPVDAQLVDQFGLTSKQICSVFHVPAYMVGVEPEPALGDSEARTQRYYSQCLQTLIKGIQDCIDDGLGLSTQTPTLAARFDLDDLLRMDTKTLADVEGIKVQRGIAAPDEARRKFNLPPVDGGDMPYLQQQNYSLSALARRDAQADPFATAPPPPPPPPPAADAGSDNPAAAAADAAAEAAQQAAGTARSIADLVERSIAESRAAMDQAIARSREHADALGALIEEQRAERARADAEAEARQAQESAIERLGAGLIELLGADCVPAP